MKTFKLVKGNEVIHIHIGATQAIMKKTVNDREDTSQSSMTPLEGNLLVANLIRKGYANQK